MKTLEEEKSIDELEKVAVNDDSEILVSMSIDGKDILQKLGIDKKDAMNLLKVIGYGTIGWEEYNVVEE